MDEATQIDVDRISLKVLTPRWKAHTMAMFRNVKVIAQYRISPLQAFRNEDDFFNHLTDESHLTWAIFNRKDQYCGIVSLHDFNQIELSMEIGITLVPEMWKKGLASEAVKAVLEIAFKEINLDKIYAVIAESNYAAIKPAERIGFIQIANNVKLDENDPLLRAVYHIENQ